LFLSTSSHLTLGTHGYSNSTVSLISHLKKSSIANPLDKHIGASIGHIYKLRLCVQDTSSKVLVIGDLNAGKSTFVNTLLRCELISSPVPLPFVKSTMQPRTKAKRRSMSPKRALSMTSMTNRLTPEGPSQTCRIPSPRMKAISR